MATRCSWQTCDDRHIEFMNVRSTKVPAETQKCWGCNLFLQTTASAFKVAISSKRKLQSIAQHTFVVVVAVVIIIDAVLGIFWLLASVSSGVHLRLQQMAGVWTAANILMNFTVCVLDSPGHPCQYMSFRAGNQTVHRDQYDSCTFCQHCKYPKPPKAHHCRKCGCCVMEMDHHCFFLNNCVGRNNLKPFLLFLGWTLLGSVYVVVCVVYLLYKRWYEVFDHLTSHSSGLGLLHWARKSYITLLFAPGWVQTCTFLGATASGAAVGVSAMLKSQLALLLAGTTYISSLKSGHNRTARHLSYVQLLRMLGSQVFMSWLWPIWHTQVHTPCRKYA